VDRYHGKVTLGPTQQRADGGLAPTYPNDLLDCSASVNQFGNALEPLLGVSAPSRDASHRCLLRIPTASSKTVRSAWIRRVLRKRIHPLHRTPRACSNPGILHGADQCPVRVRRSLRVQLETRTARSCCHRCHRSRSSHPPRFITSSRGTARSAKPVVTDHYSLEYHWSAFLRCVI